jgi:hypothetical protein
MAASANLSAETCGVAAAIRLAAFANFWNSGRSGSVLSSNSGVGTSTVDPAALAVARNESRAASSSALLDGLA